jgi:hypothetical protein
MGEKGQDLAFGWSSCDGIWSTHLGRFGTEWAIRMTLHKCWKEGYDGVLHSCDVYL